VVVEDAAGRRRVARADGLPLGTPFVRTTPRPAGRVTARGFLAALRRGPATIRGGRTTAPPDDGTVPDGTVPDGAALRQRREALGLSQRDLAALAGVSRGMLSAVEDGTRNALQSRRLIGNALALREANRPPRPAEAPALPRGE
jgi:hypothetical protein